MRPTLVSALALILAAGSAEAAMVLKSPDFKAGGKLPAEQVLNGFGCSGPNISPALDWSGAPEGTRSFAVSLYDPDAPTGSGWWHWTVFNLPADTTSLAKGASGNHALPKGAVEGRTDFGTSGYGGACPPPGKPHHYVFRVDALKVDSLPLDQNTPAAMLGFMVKANSLAEATLTVTYGR